MPIKDLFERDVERDIPPVVYFHENAPEKLASEVEEYIITGGYADGDPRQKRIKDGIHESMVRLLQAMHQEQERGPELPGSWISGFYGSGKSSFAKLLGYALDGKQLPDGTTLAEALLKRDDSAKSQELRDAYEKFTAKLTAMAVVFDIGSVARDDEHIHAAIVRQVQKRLGYCSTSDIVAEHELKLERDKEYDAFLAQAKETLGRPWSEAKDRSQADDDFSAVLHALHPDKYVEPMAWIDSRAGTTNQGMAVTEAVAAISDMLRFRAPGRTLIIVIDEVSQYVHESEDRMLKLQSLVSDLGKRMKRQAWLLVTGQQKLEDTAETVVLGKLKDRFPPHLRVHLGTTNIRDVVHRRLLKKDPKREADLRALFDEHRSDLKLYAYKCEDITEEDFVEIYPMLPGHIDLILDITTNLRARSTRVQGDTHAVRGLLQLLGELFRAQKLAERDVGDLVSIDAIYEVLHTALDNDTQNTLTRIFDHCAKHDDDEAARVARAVALLELVQEKEPTTAEHVAKCLYPRLGAGSEVDAVTNALERLREEGLLGLSEKTGYKIQSTAGQEWDKERNAFGVGSEDVSTLVREMLGALLAEAEPPRHGARKFPFAALYSDGRSASDVRIKDGRGDDAVVTIDFRYVPADEAASDQWVPKSDSEGLQDRILWVVGEHGQTGDLARRVVRSRRMINRYTPRRESLGNQKKQLLIQEEAHKDELESQLRAQTAEAFLHGTFYFRGGRFSPRELGGSFSTALHNVAERLIDKLYPHFIDIAVTPKELEQLLAHELSGPSSKFLEGGAGGKGLGIISLDGGRYHANCEGQVPARIMSFIDKEQGVSGSQLYAHFGGPPYGYAADIVRACVLGLLRGTQVRIQADDGATVTSVRDPDVVELFTKERKFRKANIFPSKGEGIGARERVRICKLFDQHFGTSLERDNDAIADAVDKHFKPKREQLREVEAALAKIDKPLPPALDKLISAFEQCTRSRHTEPIVHAVSKNLDALRDGLEQLGIYHAELTHASDAVQQLRRSAEVRDAMLAQLEAVGDAGEVAEDGQELTELLASDRPWRSIHELEPLVMRIIKQYQAKRRSLLGDQETQADAARERIKRRKGFELLNPDQAHRVLRPITEALYDTSEAAVAPSLQVIRDTIGARLERAEEEANELLDHELEKQNEQPVIRLDTGIRGREIINEAQLKALLTELEDRIGKLLADKKRVRLW